MAENFKRRLALLMEDSLRSGQQPSAKFDEIFRLVRRNKRFLLERSIFDRTCELLFDRLLRWGSDSPDIVRRILHLYAYFLLHSPRRRASKEGMERTVSFLSCRRITHLETHMLLWYVWMTNCFLHNVKFMTAVVKFNFFRSDDVPLSSPSLPDFNVGLDVIQIFCTNNGRFAWDVDSQNSTTFFIRWLVRFTALDPGEVLDEHPRGYRRIFHMLNLLHIFMHLHPYYPNGNSASHRMKLSRFFIQNSRLSVSAQDSWKGFRRVFFIAKILTEITNGNFLVSSDGVQGIKLYFRSVPDPYISTDEVREFLYVFFRGSNSSAQEMVQNIIEDYERLFHPESSQPYSPRSLKHLCRCVVRDSLTAREKVLPSAVKSLYVPQTLQQFLIGAPE